jgi:serine/threonine protein kinase
MVPAQDLTAGRVIGERYRIESLLGSGGMGVLYVAEHLFTRRKVALKLLHPSRDDDLEQLHARFLSEARTAAAVRHPHIVDVLDMGTDERGLPFLVMELLTGQSLDRELTAERALTPEDTLALLLPVMGALAVLHDEQIVHRDVKPSNIFLSETPQGDVVPKLLDFGLARVVSDLRLTRSGVVIGTPLYMAPEHAAGAPVGPAADVWSLGIVLYECLAGRIPYVSTDGAAIAAQVLAGQIRPLREVRPDVPAPLAMAVERALRRDLQHRYRDMRDFARGLLAAALAAGIRLPDDPDPIGLPGFRRWADIGDPSATLSGATRIPTSRPPPSVSGIEARASTRELNAETGPRRKRRLLSRTPGGALRPAWPLVALLALGALATLVWFFGRDTTATGVRPLKPSAEALPAGQPPDRDRAIAAPPVLSAPKPIVTVLSPAAEPPAPSPKNARKPASSAKRGKRRPADERTEEEAKPRESAPLDVETEWK